MMTAESLAFSNHAWNWASGKPTCSTVAFRPFTPAPPRPLAGSPVGPTRGPFGLMTGLMVAVVVIVLIWFVVTQVA